MKKISIRFSIAIFPFFIFSFMPIVNAQVDCSDIYSPLYDPGQCSDVYSPFYSAPSGDAGKSANIDVSCKQYGYPWCKTGTQDPAGLVKNFYIIALGLAAAAAMGVLIYGGILWTVSGAVSSKQDAMQWIWGAIWGFILLLAATLILYTINPSLVNLSNPNIPAASSTSAVTPSSPGTVTPPAGASNDAQIRQNLSQVSSGKITVNGPESQTSLNGLQVATISGVLSLFNSCGQCNIEISGGTESGHEPGPRSHASGNKLDLTPTTDLNSAIYSRIATSCKTPPPINISCGGADGNTYRYEPNTSGSGGYHWDVCFQCS